MKKTATKGSKRDATRQKQQIIVLVDGDGNYYEVPRAALERSRVSKERKKKIAAALKDVPSSFAWIRNSTIPGSIATAPFEGGRALHYSGFYLRTKSKG